MWNIFFHTRIALKSLLMQWYCRSLIVFYLNVLSIFCHNGFKCRSITFYKQWKYPAKYQKLDIARLRIQVFQQGDSSN